MHSKTTKTLACLAATALVARPAVAVPVPPPVRGLLVVDSAASGDGDRPRSIILCPGDTARERAVARAREHVASTLVQLDYAPARAKSMAARLTDDDLAIFAAHPEMLQVAGNRSISQEAFVIGALIVAGIVILAANGSATVMVR